MYLLMHAVKLLVHMPMFIPTSWELQMPHKVFRAMSVHSGIFREACAYPSVSGMQVNWVKAHVDPNSVVQHERYLATGNNMADEAAK